MPPKIDVPYKNACAAILTFASDRGMILPSKNACFERSTSASKIEIETDSYARIIPERVFLNYFF